MHRWLLLAATLWLAMPGYAADGFAGVQGMTTGGAGGPTVVAATFDALRDYMARPGPLTIQVVGKITDPAPTPHGIRIVSDKTIVGMGGAAKLVNVNLATASSSRSVTTNIILRNLTMTGGPADCVSLRRANHVWIDHCDFSDTTDGLVDVTRLSDWVTVSWCRFHYSAAFVAAQMASGHHHFFPMLIGESDHDTASAGRLHVTLHHNWFGPNAIERLPSVRFGSVHVYDNYYDHVPGDKLYAYCIEARLGAQVLAQNNVFDHSHSPLQLRTTAGATPPVLQASGNIFERCAGNVQTSGTAFAPPYAWTLEAASAVRAMVMAGAGPVK